MEDMVRLGGLEPTTSAFAGLRSNPTELQARMVPKERFELSHPFEYYALNVARLPFRHFGDTYRSIMAKAGSVNVKSVAEGRAGNSHT
jgi:hypothetical protein